MFHGTCTGPDGQILRSLLKEGLKPDPKQKAYRSPYPDEDDEDDFYEMDFDTETTMRLDESLGGAYLTTDIEEAKRYAQHACGEHGGSPLLVSAQIETRSPSVRIDEDFMVNYVWGFVESEFEPKDSDRYHLELFQWLESDEPGWERIAKDWIEKQFPQATISEHRWQQVLPAAGKMIQDIMVITFLQNHERDAASEAYESDDEDEYWDIDIVYEMQDRVQSFKENIGFVTDKLTEIAEPPTSGMHNIRILEPVGYRGANRILSIVSWTQSYYVVDDEFTQFGTVYYARTPQDAKFLMGASNLVAKYSKWDSAQGDVVYYDNPKPKEEVASVIVSGSVYRHTAADSYVEAEIFAGDQHLGFIVAKSEKLLRDEANRIYEWSKEDFARWDPDEPFGPLRFQSSPVREEALEGLVDELAGWQYRDRNDRRYLDQALAELEEQGVWQA